MTFKQNEVLQYIINYYQKYGLTPTITEIASHLFSSRTWIRECIYRLCDLGYLCYDNTRRRSIVINQPIIIY